MAKIMLMSATKAQTNLGDIFDHVEKGGSVVITKYGKEIGRFTPTEKKRKGNFKFSKEQMAHIKSLAVDLGYETDITNEIRKMRDEE